MTYHYNSFLLIIERRRFMLSNQELALVSGGAIKWTIGIVLGAIGAFLAGVLDGYLRPKCN